VDIDKILLMAETHSTDDMKNSVTDDLLSQFKVSDISLCLTVVYLLTSV